MIAQVGFSSNFITTEIQISGSKSESNRLLILKSLYPNLTIKNLSISDDTKVLLAALEKMDGEIDVHHAGTAMRFLTAFFSFKEGVTVVLTGSKRMQERPIKILVNSLREMGANITYLKNEGYPPLRIIGKEPQQNTVNIAANVSSQYISALLLVASSLKNGLTITLQGEITSTPYIKMTLQLLQQIGLDSTFDGNTISLLPVSKIPQKTITVESDWSSASYFYSIISLVKGASVTLKSYKRESLQGDSALSEIYSKLGVVTTINDTENSITLSNNHKAISEKIELDLSNTPDIAQTIAVTCLGLAIPCLLTGLHTLKIKETDRIVALKIELEKLGARVIVTDNSLELFPEPSLNKNVLIDTYNDHRMAMAFAPLSSKVPLQINEPMVVTKSYPNFWKHLQKIGFLVDFKE
ncbi:3-phosphoshikimate 1-carboxyvinyltransferase [Patiriisocius hiemis]|uniref:3-phosphoshikimate 1-carboxyvinyltransferase n=1 Tax=Patiriisocius hiemis TaxID=3075604 RepID=A0ABU2YC80_9FLAO|nr:3-phosphoshikimate 1-carboxyvinyltransferase [Constantimarinum sp. W242]MDT0555783.1 3-phosphoshikimate 1-carboxyvinyltransferase [Constantimarinum sp. W242]